MIPNTIAIFIEFIESMAVFSFLQQTLGVCYMLGPWDTMMNTQFLSWKIQSEADDILTTITFLT